MNAEEITEEVADLLERLAADLSPTGLRLEAGMYDLARRRWVAGRGAGEPTGFGEDDYVLTLPGRQRLLPTEQSGMPDLLAIIDDVREWAMDELGHGWPELCDDTGNFLALLEPVRDGSRYVWAAPGHTSAMIGDLASLQIALPPNLG